MVADTKNTRHPYSFAEVLRLWLVIFDVLFSIHVWTLRALGQTLPLEFQSLLQKLSVLGEYNCIIFFAQGENFKRKNCRK